MNNKKSNNLFGLFLLFAGILIGTFHYIRRYSSVSVLLFMVLALLLSNYDKIKKIKLLICLLRGLALSIGYFMQIINQYTTYAREHFTEFNELQVGHPFWHSVYIGFGFLKFRNQDQIIYDDGAAFSNVKSINPEVTIVQTAEYEEVIKKEVLNFIKNQLLIIPSTHYAVGFISLATIYGIVSINQCIKKKLFEYYCACRNFSGESYP